jgi:glycosyltransferase involved in cell wall biosynthesis
MATGAPCVATPVTGCVDFFDETVGYPIDYEIRSVNLSNYNLKSDAHIPDTYSMMDQIQKVFNNYKQAQKLGKRASERIRTKFTWKNAAKRLNDIVLEVHEKSTKEKAEIIR